MTPEKVKEGRSDKDNVELDREIKEKFQLSPEKLRGKFPEEDKVTEEQLLSSSPWRGGH